MIVTRAGASSRGVRGGGMIIGPDVGLDDDLVPSVMMAALGIMRMRRGKEGRILSAHLESLYLLLKTNIIHRD
jgi:hypothetical protein